MTHKFFGKSLGDTSDLAYPKMTFDNSKLIIDSKEQFEKMLPEIEQWQNDLLDKVLKDKEAMYRSLYGGGRQSGKTLTQMDMAKLEDAYSKLYGHSPTIWHDEASDIPKHFYEDESLSEDELEDEADAL